MCGRYTLSSQLRELARVFHLVETDAWDDLLPRFNVAPSQQVPIVVRGPQGNRLLRARWGFQPEWSRGDGPRPINARADHVATGGLFRSAFRSGRCALLADGFYEWQDVAGSGPKQPWFVRAANGEPLTLAGLWTPERSDRPATCAIVTVAPNEVVAPLHDRMPAILDERGLAEWLAPLPPPVARLPEILRPAAAGLLEAWPVSHRINDVSAEGPELAAPAGAA